MVAFSGVLTLFQLSHFVAASPFQALCGYPPSILAININERANTSPSAYWAKERTTIVSSFKDHLQQAQNRMKLYAY